MKHATAVDRAVSLLGFVLSGCASAAASGVKGGAPVAPPALASPPRADDQAPLPPATPEEQAMAERLRTVVSHLAVDIGERHAEKSWNLAEATDDIARSLEQLGFSVRRQGFAVGEDVLQNLEVTVPGHEHGDETVVVGAHYDTAPGTPGADDNATGVAAVLELAREFRDLKPSRTLRFVLFANGEGPHTGTATPGSLVYVKDLVSQGVRVSAAVNVDGIGVYRTSTGSQKPPATAASRYPSVGNFVTVVGNPASRALVTRVAVAMKRRGPVPVVEDVADEGAPYSTESDQWAFWTVGLSAVWLTDTGAFRYREHHGAKDLPAEIDFTRTAWVVSELRSALEEIAGPMPGAEGAPAATP